MKLIKRKPSDERLLTVKEAYELLKKEKPGEVVVGAGDFGDFYIFNFLPESLANTDQFIISGTFCDAVDKKTGKIFRYDLFSDFDAYEKSVPIDLKTFL